MTSTIRKPGPVTLTPGQYGATAAAKKPGASYEGYLAYINRRRAAKLGATQPPAVDPFAATTPAQIDQTVNRFTGMYGTPLTDPQITQRAQGMLDPILAAVTNTINNRAAQATGAIGANSAALAKTLAAVDYAAPYAGAKQEQAAVDAALQQSLTGGGQTLAGDLRSRLAAINDPTVAAAADQTAAQGAAAGTTELARGSSALSSLIAKAAAAKEYGARLPGIAQLTGLQDIAGVQRDAVNQIGSQAAEIQRLAPQIVQGLRGENQNLRSNRAQAAAQLYGLLTGQNITRATAKAGLTTDAARIAAAAAPLPDASLSRVLGYPVDQYGQPVGGAVTPLPGFHVDPSSGRVVKDTPPPKQPKQPMLSPKDAIKLADDLRYGIPPKQQWDSRNSVFVDVPGTGQPNSSYSEAYANLVAAGLPPDRARALVNSRYKPGEYGRPLSPGQKKTNAAVKAGLGLPRSPFDQLLAGGR